MSPADPEIDPQIDAARSAERAGDWPVALACYQAALQRAREMGEDRTVADLLRWIGTVHRKRGEMALAVELYQESLDHSVKAGLPGARAAALTCLGTTAQYRGELETAKSLYVDARRLAQGTADHRLTAMIDQNLGTLFNIQGDLRNALMRYEVALHTSQKLKDPGLGMRCLNNLGMIHVDLGEWLSAARCFDHAAALADQLGDAEVQGLVSLNRAELHLKLREFDLARACCDKAFEVFSLVDSAEGQAEAHKFYGVLYRKTGKPNLAKTHFTLAVQLAQQCEDRLLEAESEYQRAQLHLDAGQNSEAMRCLNRAHGLFSDLHARRDLQNVDRRLDRLEQTFVEVMRGWAESIESKDPYTAGHSARVADYACMLAEALGITGRDLIWFRMGAFLHDVGKISVPLEVLNKPGKLTPEEWAAVQRHTVEGDRIIAELNFPWDIRPLVRSHHERWDGSGYPDGLRGEQIPLHARILCVADVYDALTSTRSYRPALSQDEALRVMEEESGQVVEPRLFELFRRLIRSRAEAAPAGADAPGPEPAPGDAVPLATAQPAG